MPEIPTTTQPHIPHATIMGLKPGQILWTSDFSATRDDSGQWTGGESFYVNILETTQFLPQNGASCQFPGFAFLKVNGCKVENYEGDICLVNVVYKGNENWNAEIPQNEEDPGNGKYKTELVVSTSEEPLLSHIKYSIPEFGIPDDEKILIQNIQSGKFIPLSTKEEDAYKYVDVNNHLEGKYFEVTSVKGKEAVDFLANGVESYRAARQRWKASYTSDKQVPAIWLNRCGLISTPKGDPPAVTDGRTWFFAGVTSTQNGEVYDISMEWELSGFGGWQPKLYDKSNFNLTA